MGFMDSVSVFTKGVGAKAKGNYDVVALNSQINMCKKEIASLEAQLGQIYYELHKDDPEDQLKDIVNAINEKKNQIDDLNNQINETKEATAAIQLTVPVNNTTSNSSERKCCNCGTVLAVDAVFCVNCGTKNELTVEEDTTEVTDNCVELDSTENEIKAEMIEKSYCNNCGTELGVDDMFCPECGTKQ